MKITPIEIRKYEFKKVMRGYDVDEVRYFLEMVADELEAINREKLDLESKAERYDTELHDYRQIEKSMQDALIVAKETSDKSIQNARKEAELIIGDAEAKADRIVEDARKEAVRIQSDVTRLKMQRDAFLVKIKNLLRSEMELLHTVEEENEDVDDFETDELRYDYDRSRHEEKLDQELFADSEEEEPSRDTESSEDSTREQG